MFEMFCPGFINTPQNSLGLFAGCVYSYQTLIAGVLAILAAYFAARPVWKQVKDTSLQTMINQRETISERVNEAIDRFQRVKNEMDETLQALMHATWDPAGEPIAIDDNTAYGLHMSVAGKLNWYLETLRDTEAHEIEVAKARLREAREELGNTLDTAYWPASHSQSDEDYSFTDQEWEDVQEKARHAKSEAADKASTFASSWRALVEVQSDWVKKSRQKISALDDVITAS
ncbi:hypothetical protein [Tateyamaria sp. Alg231-49]|uniref:hypothetical protein n=1 Tax=Tateyamaria sp. Alg231-49 TaxID=1922219 RepID=UPI000D560D26|nr:hypothetical protein [Tateyamaria sp. Alg231-49]